MKRLYYYLAFLIVGMLAQAQSITGTTASCINDTESYGVSGVPQIGTIFNWSAVGGVIQGSSTSSTVSIKWTSSGTRRVDVTAITPGGLSGGGGFGGPGGGSGGETHNLSLNVNVSAATNAGSLSTSFSHGCANNAVNLTSSGKVGTIKGWEVRIKYGSGSWGFWSQFSSSSSTSRSYTLSTTSATQTRFQFRVKVQNNDCSVQYATSSEVLVDPVTLAGSISGSSNRCGNGSVTYSLSGHRGTIHRWQTRYKNGSGSWTSWSTYTETNNVTSISPTLSQWSGGQRTYEVRAVVKNGNYCNTLYPAKQTTVDRVTVAGTVSGNSTRCGSGSHSLSISGHTGTIQRWQSRYKNGSGGWSGWSTITETDNVTSVSPTLSQWNSGVRTYEVRAVVKSGSCSTLYPKKTITVDPVTVAGTVGGNSNRCGSGSHSLSLSGHTGTIQRWQSRYKNGSGGWSGWSTITETDNVTSVSPTLSQWNSGVRTYEVRAVVKSGTCSTLYPKKTITVDPVTVAGTVSASSSRCGTGSHSFSLSGHTGSIYRWQSRYRNGSGGWSSWSTVTETDNVTSISPTLNQWSGGVRTYEVRAVIQSGSNCSILYPKKTVAVNPMTGAASISGGVSARCQGGGTTDFNASASHATSYGWSISPSSAGSINSAGLVTWNSGFSGTATVSVTATGTCGSTNANKTVSVTPLTGSPTISSGVSTRCQGGGTTDYNVSAANANSYSWSISPSSAGSINSSGLVTWNNEFSGTATITANATGLCNTTSGNRTVTITPLTGSPTISSGVSTRCQGSGTMDYNASASGATSYSWSISPSSAGSINSAGLVTWNSGFSGTATVSVTATGACSSTSTNRSVTVTPLTNSVTFTSGATTRCQGSGTSDYNAAALNATSYSWSLSPSSAGSINSAGLVTWNSGFSGTATVSVTATGTCNSTNANRTVTVTPLTGSATISSGVSTRCQGGGTTDYNVSAANANSFAWSISPSTAGSINTAGLVTWNNEFSGTATISVIATGTCNSTIANKTVTVTPLTGSASISSGVTTRCQGSGTTDYNASAANASSYSWSISPSSAGSINNAGLVTWNSGFTGTATVSVTATGTCNSTNANRTVTVTPLTGSASISSGVSTRCQGSGTTDYNASAANATSYSWSISPTSAGSINNAGLVTWNGGFSGTATVSVTATGTCGSTNANQTVTVNSLTGIASITGASTRCQGSGTTDYNASAANATSYSWSLSPTSAGSINNAGLVTWNNGFSGTATVSVTANGTCNNTTANQSVSVTQASDPGVLSGQKEGFGIASGTLELQGYIGSIVKWQSRTSSTWTDISHTTPTLPYTVVVPTYYRVVVQNANCDIVESNEVLVNILPLPTVTVSGPSNIRPGQTTRLEATPGYANYQWLANDSGVQNGSLNTYAVTSVGSYKVTITSAGGAAYTTPPIEISDQLSDNENMVITHTFRIPVNLPNEDLNLHAYSADEISTSIGVFDGLGREKQTISVNGSANLNDIVIPVEYDEYGRKAKSYLPYADSNTDQLYKPNALADQLLYYQTNHNSSVAFAETSFEQSPLSRPVEQGAPGEAWQLGGASISYDYGTNADSEVRYFKMMTLLTADSAFYGAGELLRNTIKDEDGNLTIEYTNQQGQTILKKSHVGDSTWAETYYVYDIYGNLSAVIPPEATSRLTSDFYQAEADRTAFLNLWAFLYEYDDRNRMVIKKVPGADTIHMVYDRWDRLVLTQDGNQRANGQWLFTKYDELNRPIMTGIMNGADVSTERAAIDASSVRFDSLDLVGPNQYSNRSYPTSGIDEYFTVTYYDNYEFRLQSDWANAGLSFTNPAGLNAIGNLKGQVTGTMTKIIDDNIVTPPDGWIRSVNYYDDRYRVIQTQSTNHLGGKDVVTNYYDFIGQVTKSVTSHSDGSATTDITRRFEYDHAGRLLNVYHQIDAETEVLLASNTYNELGELIEKKLHNDSPIEGGQGGVFSQSLNYTYNIRGWLTSINDPELNSIQDTNTDLFGMNLHYNNTIAALGNEANFNGNISAMEWSDYESMGANTRAYAYTYDDLNRLKSANHFDGGATSSYDVSGINYDLNGNILNLTRNGASGAMDLLDYDYTVDYANNKGGNQLRYVNDTSADSTGFNNNGTGTNEDYSYDRNGNMMADANKGITSIDYNHLNLPTTVILSNSEGSQDSINYLYDAAGIKLSQSVYDSGVLVKKTDYVGEFIYENDTVQFIQHEEGRIIPKSPFEGGEGIVYDYQYHLKDHLGNVRLTFSATPEDYSTVQNMESVNDAGSESETPTNFVNIPYRQDVNANTTIGGDEVATLNVGSAGVMSLIRVKKNDAMSFSVYANYVGDPTSSDLASIAGGLIFNAYNNGATSSGLEGLPTGASSEISDAVTAMTNGAGSKSSNGNAPKAYLNYIYFEKNMAYHSAGFAQISEAAKGLTAHELITLDAGTMDTDGYILVYLTNENNAAVSVNFDDLTINHTIVNDVVSTQDYYPFGLTFNESVRVASSPQKYKFGAKEEQDWGVLDFHARMFDPAIGRTTTVDPLTEQFYHQSMYSFFDNNPSRFTDPTGMSSQDTVKTSSTTGTTTDQNSGDDDEYSALVQYAANFIAMWQAIYEENQEDVDTQVDYYYQLFGSGVYAGSDASSGDKIADIGYTIAMAQGIAVIKVGRRGAFRKAKRDAKIPMNAKPIKVKKVAMTNKAGKQQLDASGKPIYTREYTYRNSDGKEIVIQDHTAGHVFDDGGKVGSHFNIRSPDADGPSFRNSTVKGTEKHYNFRRRPSKGN